MTLRIAFDLDGVPPIRKGALTRHAEAFQRTDQGV
jgi:hypothetical protein